MQRVVVILICLSLAACSNYTALRKPGWLKNPFSDSEPETEPAARTGRSPAERTWYCYGEAEQRRWDCQDHPASEQLRSPGAVGKSEAALTQQTMQQPMQQTSLVATSSTPPPPMPEFVPKPDPETELKPESEPEPEAAIDPVIPESGADVSGEDKNLQFIMSHPADHYAVQLIALESLAEVLAYAADQHIEDPLYARILTRDQIWVVLLLGIYPDRNTAVEAIDQWSTSHELKESPWIRKLDTLIDAMKGASGEG